MLPRGGIETKSSVLGGVQQSKKLIVYRVLRLFIVVSPSDFTFSDFLSPHFFVSLIEFYASISSLVPL